MTKPEWQEFNVNDRVKVKVTARGADLHDRWYRALRLEPPQIKVDAEGWSEFHLWEAFMLFGPGMYHGCDVPFETTFKIKPEAT